MDNFEQTLMVQRMNAEMARIRNERNMSVSNIERIYNLKVGDRIRNKTTGGTNSGKFGVITAIHPGLTLADPYVVQYDDGKTGQGSDEHYEKIVEEDKFGPESYRIKFNPDD